MKTGFIRYCTIILAVIAFSTCVKDPDPIFELSPVALSWKYNETDAKTVTVTANYKWKVSVDAAYADKWNIELAEDGKSFTVAPAAEYTLPSNLTTKLTVTSARMTKTVLCTQTGKPSSFLDISTESLFWMADSKEAKTVTVSSNYNWTASLDDASKDKWNLVLLADGKSFSVAPKAVNESTSRISATVTVNSEGLEKKLSCEQAAVAADMEISPLSLSWQGYETDARTVTVNSVYAWKASLPDNAKDKWMLTVAEDSKSFTVAPKSENASREAVYTTVTISTESQTSSLVWTVTCLQAAAPAVLELNPGSLLWKSSETDARTVAVTSNYDWTATIPDADKDKWSLVTGSDGKSFTIAPAAENTGINSIKTIVTVASAGITRELSCTQTSTEPYLEINPSSLSWSRSDTTSNVGTGNANRDWTASLLQGDQSKWKITPAADGKSLTVAPVGENESTQPRIAIINVSAAGLSRVLSGTQEYKPAPILSLSTNALAWAYNDTTAIVVSVMANYSWKASLSEQDAEKWSLRVASDGKSFIVAPKSFNRDKSPVSAVISVTSEGEEATLLCRHAIAPVDLSLSASSLSWRSDDLSTVTVNVSSNYDWQASIEESVQDTWELKIAADNQSFTVRPKYMNNTGQRRTALVKVVSSSSAETVTAVVSCTQAAAPANNSIQKE